MMTPPKAKSRAWKRKGGTWKPTGQPTRDDIIRGLRTFISMCACWLDRDPAIRGKDTVQQTRLLEILEVLSEAETAQRDIANTLLAIAFKDNLAAALGTATSPTSEELDRARTTFPAESWESMVPVKIASRQGKDQLPAALQAGIQAGPSTSGHPLQAVIENMLWQYSLATGLAGPSPECVTKVVQQIEADRKPARLSGKTGGRIGGDEAASKAVVSLGLIPDADVEQASESSARLLKRKLEMDRHPDRPGLHGVGVLVDEGAYFGAPVTRAPERDSGDTFDARAHTAAQLIAEAAGAGPEVTTALALLDDGRWPGIWNMAAKGRP